MILFTAFEPSGDALAATMIESLLEARPGMKIYALGGPRMEAAGAELIESTTGEAKMIANAVSQALSHRQRVIRLGRWLKEHPIQVLVPTDSPAANWAVCKAVRKARPEATIVHLVCPQIWAWASWRVRRLQRLSDHVLCLLPFEPAWLGKHGVPATFVGHPLFETPNPKSQIPNVANSQAEDEGLPQGDGPKVALLPGSRKQEITNNWPTMLAVFERLQKEVPGLSGVVAGREAADETALREASHDWPLSEQISVRYGITDEVIEWADAVIGVSGTVSLQVAARHRPMVVLYGVSRLAWSTVGWWLINTRTFSLPNLIGQYIGLGSIVPEFVPHFGRVEPIAEALKPLLTGGPARERQLEAFVKITQRFEHMRFRQATVRTLLRVSEA